MFKSAAALLAVCSLTFAANRAADACGMEMEEEMIDVQATLEQARSAAESGDRYEAQGLYDRVMYSGNASTMERLGAAMAAAQLYVSEGDEPNASDRLMAATGFAGQWFEQTWVSLVGWDEDYDDVMDEPEHEDLGDKKYASPASAE